MAAILHNTNSVWPSGELTGWLGGDLIREHISHRLSVRELTALRELVRQCVSKGLSLTDIRREHFNHPALDPLLAELGHRLRCGPELVLIEGVPIEDYDHEGLRIVVL